MGKGMKAGKKKSPGGGAPKGLGAQQQQQMKQLQAMQRQMEEMQAEIDAKEVTTTAGGGAVEITANGKKEIVSLKIDPDVLNPDDVEMIQDLIIVAVNEALRQIDEISQAETEKITGGLNLPF